MGAAAAEVTVERGDDGGAARPGRSFQERAGADQDAGEAVAALAGLVLDEDLEKGPSDRVAGKPLDGRHPAAGDGLHRQRAGEARVVVDQHQAGAALFEAAAVAGAGEVEAVPENEEKRLARIVIDADVGAVDPEAGGLGQGTVSESGPEEAWPWKE